MLRESLIYFFAELREIRAQEASGGRGGGQVSVAATPKTDSVRTKAAAHAAAAAAVSVGDAIAICDSFAACGKKNCGAFFFARRAKKFGESGLLQRQFSKFRLFWMSQRRFL